MHEIIDDQLIELQKKLEKLTPDSTKILGHLKEQQRNNGFVNRYFVDSWPDVSAVIAIPGDLDPRLRFLRKVITSFAVSESKMRTALSSKVLDWTKPIIFEAFPYKYISVLEDVIAKEGNPTPVRGDDLCHTMVATLSDLPKLEVPKNMVIGELDSSNAEFVQGAWAYSKVEPGSYDYIKWTIETQQSIAIFDRTENEDKLVGFMLRQYYGSLGMMYVEPSYRGKGLGKYLVTELARKIPKNNDNTVYVYVTKENEISYCLHKKCGFREVPDLDIIWKCYVPSC